MATPSETFQVLTDYYTAARSGDPDSVERAVSYYADDKPTYIAGNSALSGTMENTEQALKYLMDLRELNGGDPELLAQPVILVAGDRVVATLAHQRYHRPGGEEIIVPRLCVYEVADGKIQKAFAWQLESEKFDAYFPRSEDEDLTSTATATASGA